MRRATIALAVLLATTSACAHANQTTPQVASAHKGTAGSTSSATPSAGPSDDPDAPLKFSQCMRDHGMTWFPDPADGKMTVRIPRGTDPKKMEAAQEACKQYAPNGGEPPKMSAEDLQKARDMAKCMRENGVPNFPDPDPNGGIRIDGSKLGTGPGDPTFDKAEKACDKYEPQGTVKQERG
jgi:hypothetical protein